MFYDLLPQRRFPAARAVIIALLLLEYSLFVRPQSQRYDYFELPDVPAAPLFSEAAPKIVSQTLLTAPEPMSHAAAAAPLPGGGLLALWYSGSGEGKSDVKIYSSRRIDGVWTAPEEFLSRQELAKRTGRYVKTLGNPVLFLRDGRLYCWVVSVGFGGWSGSSLNLWVNAGGSAGSFRRLKLSPLLNLSNLARCAPVEMGHDRLGLPFYHELIKKYARFAIVDDKGRVLRRARIPAAGEALQPAVIPLGNREALALMRRAAGAADDTIPTAKTADAGRSWQAAEPLAIENHDSSLAAARMGNRLFLAANPGSDRSKLVLYEAAAEAPYDWKEVLTLEEEPGCEFSYPVLLAGGDGTLELLYTWKREGIKAVTIAFGEENQ